MFIFSNLATSVDGKIATASRAYYPLGTSEDRRVMGVLRAQADAVIVGAGTLRTFHSPMLVDVEGAAKTRRTSGRKKQPINIVVSSHLEGISPKWDFFTSKLTKKILFCHPTTSPSQIKKFEPFAEIFVLDKKGPSAIQIVRILKKLGIKKLLVEGGGGLMWDFAKPGLIDEFHVTLTPKILGGTEAPTLVDGAGFEPKQVLNLKLKACRQFGDELYLVYKKTSKRG
jgi:5-amino-6-(5-phosphoribosylamino)uracil reductase